MSLTRLALPSIGLGTYRNFDITTQSNTYASLRQVLQIFAEHGGGVVDTSPMYGHAEAILGKLIHELGVRDQLFLATKIWTQGREAGIRQMEHSLHLLGTDSLELMQIHNLTDWQTHLKTLTEWKSQARIKYIGISHYHAGAYPLIEQVMRLGKLDYIQINYSIAERDAESRLLPLAQELGIGVIVNCPLGQGSLIRRLRHQPLPAWAQDYHCSSWAKLLLTYVISHPAVTCAIPGTGNPQHMMENMQCNTGKISSMQEREALGLLLSRCIFN